MKTFFNVIGYTIKKPNEFIQFSKRTWGKVIGYVFLLSLILSLPLIYQSIEIAQTFKKDSNEIIKKIPEFDIKDGKLNPKNDEEGFVYQTDSIVFTFDPDNKRTLSDIQQDQMGRALPIALMDKQIVLVLPQSSSTTDVVDTKTFTFPYASIPKHDSFNKESLTKIVNSRVNINVFMSVIIVTSLFMMFGSFIFSIFFLTLLANISNKLTLVPLKFSETFKILVYASTLPVVAATILSFIFPTLPASSLVSGVTILLFFMIQNTIRPRKVK